MLNISSFGEREKLKQEGKCYYYSKTTHVALQCQQQMKIIQYRIEVIECAEWHPNYIPSYERFQIKLQKKYTRN